MKDETIQEYLERYLDERAVGESTSKLIIESFKAQPYNEEMVGRWHNPAKDYRPILIPLTIALNGHVVKWCKYNMPQAFFIPMFTD